MSAELWKTIFDWATVVLIALTVVSGAGALITGNIINKRQDTRLRQFELDIAKANERAAEANRIAEQEKLARVQLEEKVAWRSVSKEQQHALAANLSHFAGQFVNCGFLSSDMEAFSFSSEIAAALRAAKWQVIPPNPNVLTIKETSLPTTASPIQTIDFGVEVVSTSDEKSVASAHALARELDNLGFDTVFKSTPQHPPNGSWVWVTVQHRPLGPQGEAKLRASKKTDNPS